MTQRIAYIMYAHACKSTKKEKKRKHISRQEREENLTNELKEKEAEINEIFEKSGYLVLNEQQAFSYSLDLNSFAKKFYYATKKGALDSAHSMGYTHYCLKDILVKFRESRVSESSYYSQLKKREINEQH